MRMLRPTVRPWYGRRRRGGPITPPAPETENMVVVDGETVVVDGEVVVYTE